MRHLRYSWCYHRTWFSAYECAIRRATDEHLHMYVRKVRRVNPKYPASKWTVRTTK